MPLSLLFAVAAMQTCILGIAEVKRLYPNVIYCVAFF